MPSNNVSHFIVKLANTIKLPKKNGFYIWFFDAEQYPSPMNNIIKFSSIIHFNV